jgi:hypothetical protein
VVTHSALTAPWREGRALFEWTCSELRELAQVLRERFAATRSGRVLVEAIDGQLSLRDLVTTDRDVVHMALTDEDPVRDGFASDLPPDWKGQSAIAVLPDRDVLCHDVRLPTAVIPELGAAMRLWLERELPLQTESLTYEWKVIQQEPESGSVVVRVIAARRELVEKYLNRIRSLGLRPVQVGVAGVPGPGGSIGVTGNLMVGAWSRHPRQRLVRVINTSVKIGVAMGILAVILLIARGGYERWAMAADLRDADTAVQQYDRLRMELQRRSEPMQQISRLLPMTDAGDVLVYLTENIPSNSWIYDLHIFPAQDQFYEIKGTGMAPRVGELMRLLEQLPALRDVKMISGRSAGLNVDQDRVEFSAKWQRLNDH